MESNGIEGRRFSWHECTVYQLAQGCFQRHYVCGPQTTGHHQCCVFTSTDGSLHRSEVIMRFCVDHLWGNIFAMVT